MITAEQKRIVEFTESICHAMSLAIVEANRFSMIADPIDEARLEGMQAMQTLVETTIRQCESR